MPDGDPEHHAGERCLRRQRPHRAGTLDDLALLDKFKQRCEQRAAPACRKIHSTTQTTIKPTPDDYEGAAADNLREFGEVGASFNLVGMFEFVRQSTFASTLTTMLSLTRAAAQNECGRAV